MTVQTTQARDAMTRKIITISPNASLFEAWALMIQFDIRHLLVLEQGELLGILSDRDVLYWSRGEGEALSVPGVLIEEVMTRVVLSCREDQSIAYIADMMLTHRIDALPVLSEDDELKGLITSSDLLALLAESQYEGQPLLSIPYAFEMVDWTNYTIEEDELPRPRA